MWQLPSAEFQKAEIVFNPPNIGTDYKELRMPIILGKQMDILNHKHLRTTQMLQFGTKYGNRSWPFFVSFYLNEGTCQDHGRREGGRKDPLGWKMKKKKNWQNWVTCEMKSFSVSKVCKMDLSWHNPHFDCVRCHKITSGPPIECFRLKGGGEIISQTIHTKMLELKGTLSKFNPTAQKFKAENRTMWLTDIKEQKRKWRPGSQEKI